ncbi:MAG: hypothetical protein AAFV09_00170 [Pseudomonadota bacterium]
MTRYRGTGPRAILSHCSLAHSGAWKPLMARMPEVDGTALDLPGHGMSAYNPDSELQRQGADAVLEALDDGPAQGRHRAQLRRAGRSARSARPSAQRAQPDADRADDVPSP